jgi:perosamine synthetase
MSAMTTDSLDADGRLADAVLRAVRRVVRRQGEFVALHEPEFAGREWEYVKECLDSGWVSSVGKYVDRFERMLAEYTGSSFAIATSNGTSALHVCLLLAGVKPGDEVLIPTLTFVATANAVTYVGAVPHFVDSEAVALGVDARKLDLYLRESCVMRDGACVNQRTGAVVRALLPMHTFGFPADLRGLLDVCQRWHLTLVEDAAESLGARYEGRHTGTFGAVSALSFNGNKIVTTGGGGAILTSDAALAKRAKHLTTTARVAHRWSFIHDEVGYNYRMPNINAALGCAQLERMPEFLARKSALHRSYLEELAAIQGIKVVDAPIGTEPNYWLITLLLDEPSERCRDTLLQVLNEAQLMARPAWTLMHELPMYVGCPRMDLSQAESLAARIINVPSSAKLASEQP